MDLQRILRISIAGVTLVVVVSLDIRDIINLNR